MRNIVTVLEDIATILNTVYVIKFMYYALILPCIHTVCTLYIYEISKTKNKLIKSLVLIIEDIWDSTALFLELFSNMDVG